MQVDGVALGQRIASARVRAGLTQQELAAEIGMDRSALAKIERGDRRVTALELARIAEASGNRFEWFLEDAPPAIVSRRNAQDPGAPSPRIDARVESVARSVEFMLAHDDRFDIPRLPQHGALVGVQEAEDLAAEARHAMSVDAHGPLVNLGQHVEAMGLLPFILEMGPDSADAATVLLESGAVSIVNGNLRIGRRRLALAHELGHALVADDYSIDWRVAEYSESDRRESLFDRFARALLLPADSLTDIWRGPNQEERGLREIAIRTASEYRVDMATLARRLTECGLLGHDQAGYVRGLRTTRADIVTMNLVVGEELVPGSLPERYERAVLRLFESESVSRERALDLMLGTWEEADLPPLPTRPEETIWQYV